MESAPPVPLQHPSVPQRLAIKRSLLIRLLVVIDNKIGACAEDGYKHRNKNHTDFLFH